MATAGVSSNKESQIKYLRAQAEYDFAWVKYFDEIYDTSDEWSYLRTVDGKHHIIMALVEDIYHIDANNLIEQIANAKNHAVDNYNETIEALNNFDALKAEYNKAVETLKEIGSKIPSSIYSRYDLNSYNVYEWGNYFRG